MSRECPSEREISEDLDDMEVDSEEELIDNKTVLFLKSRCFYSICI